MNVLQNKPEIFFFILSLLFFFLGFYEEEKAVSYFVEKPTSSLRIVTWNIGGSQGKMGHPFDLEYLPQITKILQQLDPDLAFLQEVKNYSQLKSIQQNLGAKEWQADLLLHGERNIAVLWKRGRCELFSVSSIKERPAVLIEYDSKENGSLQALCLHAHAFSAKKRNIDTGLALEYLFDNAFLPKVLLGDLNLDINLKEKKRNLFSDNEYRDVETYNIIASKMIDVGLHKGNTAEPDRRLDYIFVEKDCFIVSQAGPWKGCRVGDMDHEPVVADLKIKK